MYVSYPTMVVALGGSDLSAQQQATHLVHVLGHPILHLYI
jgi:hypothetical protein